jgi:hypothetical protein
MKMEIVNPAKDHAHGQNLNEMDNIFWEHYRTILQDAIKLTEDRQESYVGDGNCIIEQAICGEAGYVYEINKKNHRLKGLYQLEAKGLGNQQKTADSVEDTLLDLINHAAFHLSYRRMVAARENIAKPKLCRCSINFNGKDENDPSDRMGEWVVEDEPR